MKPVNSRFRCLAGYWRAAAVTGLLMLCQQYAVAGHPAEPELLDADQAFRVTARRGDARTVELNYSIADGYYMYRDRFAFTIDGKPVRLGKSRYPAGQVKEDATFGRVVTYRKSVRLLLPVNTSGKDSGGNGEIEVVATSQGCADIGVCYPPLRQRLRLAPGSSAEVGPAGGDTATTGFSRPAREETLRDLLIKGH